MVVLDGHGTNQVLSGANGGPNQYLQPDYLSPLPTTLDSKKSPLALLVQTCSQIGADSPSTKFDNQQSHHKRKSSLNVESTRYESDSNIRPQSGGSSGSNSSSSSNSNYKISHPIITSNTNNNNNGKVSPHQNNRHSISSKLSSSTTESNSNNNHHHQQNNSSSNNNNGGKLTPPSSAPSTTGRSLKRSGSSSSSSQATSPVPSKVSRVSPPVSSASSNSSDKETKKESSSSHRKSPSENNKSSSSSTSAQQQASSAVIQDPQGANPIVRSGLEILNGGRLPGNPGIPMPPSLSALSGYPSSAYGSHDPSSIMNPAFRLPFLGGPSGGGHPFAGYPGGSPYVSYTRVKTPSGGESIVPVCKDPNCTGCQFSNPYANNQSAGLVPGFPGFSAGAGFCPAGCVQCDHQKIPYHFALSMGYPPSLLSQHSALMQQQQQHQQHQQQQAVAAAMTNVRNPYVCNWFFSNDFCGKRFSGSEELLQHLRTHTQNLASGAGGSADAAMAAAQQQLAASSLYSSAMLNPSAIANIRRTYATTTPPMSPYANAGKHGGGLGVPPGYYPPVSAYSLYGQLVGPPVLP